jgi:ubiquinone/menaquinone biosynthesis C-methylase UbiE
MINLKNMSLKTDFVGIRCLITLVLNNAFIFDLLLKLTCDIKRDLILKEINVKESEAILEIACAIGHLSSSFPQSAYVGIDTDEKYIKFARERNKDRSFKVMSAYNLGFEENYFDYVLVSGFFHHIEDGGIIKVLNECKIVLKKRGKIIILEPTYPSSRFSILKKILCWLDRGRYIRLFKEYSKLFISPYRVEKSYVIPIKVLGLLRYDLCMFVLSKEE